MMITRRGFRSGVAMILANSENKVLWARRVEQNGWQFPQGGLKENETPEQAMYRELHEEIGLTSNDVKILAVSKDWLRYRLPSYMVRQEKPLCIGQRLKWYLLRLIGNEQNIHFDETDFPEFDTFRWVNYWYPLRQVVDFKRQFYKRALTEFSPVLF